MRKESTTATPAKASKTHNQNRTGKSSRPKGEKASDKLTTKHPATGEGESSKDFARAEELLATRKYYGQKIEAKLRDALDKPDELRRLIGAIDAAERKASEMLGKAFDEKAVNYAFKAYSAALKHYYKHEGERAALSRLVINYAEMQGADPSVDLDLVAVAEAYERAASLVASLYERGASVPDWLTDLILRGLEAATEKTGVEHSTPDGNLDLRGISDLFAVTASPKFKLEFEQKKDLPELISEVLRHSDTPINLYNAIGDAVTEWAMDDTDPTYIRLALANLVAVRKEIAKDEADEE